MKSRVVSISRTCHRRRRDRLVANDLGFRYVNDEIIIKADEHAGVSPETVAEVEHSQTLIDRVLEGMAAGGIGYIPSDVLIRPQSRIPYQNLI